MTYFKDRYFIYVIIAALMTFAALFSLLVLSNQSLRLDEAQSLWQTSRSLSGVFKTVAQDVHVPLYYLLLHFWQHFFGNGVGTVRVLSFIFFIFSIPAIYFLGRSSLGYRSGLLAAAMVAVSPFMTWYGSETRMYSLIAFFTILNHLCFLRIYQRDKDFIQSTKLRHSFLRVKLTELFLPGPSLRPPEKYLKTKRTNVEGWWWGYGLTAFLGLFTHYFFAFILIAQATFYFINKRDLRKQTVYLFVLIALILMICVGGWLYFVQTLGFASNTRPLLDVPNTVNLFNTFSNFIFGFQNDSLNTFILSLWPVVVIIGFLSLRRSVRLPREVQYFLIAGLLPVFLAFAVSLIWQPIYLTRYLILSAPPVYLFLSWIINTMPKGLSAVLRSAVVVSMVLMLTYQTTSASTPVREDYQAVSSYLNNLVSPDDIVVVSAPFTIYPILYYYHGPAVLSSLPPWNRYQIGAIPPFSSEELPKQANFIAERHRRLWLVLSYDQGYEETIRLYFEKNYQRLLTHEFSPGLNLYVYQLRYE